MTLKIDGFVLELAGEMRGVLTEIGRHDRDLERQARAALTSIVLNGREGARQLRGSRRARRRSTRGSAGASFPTCCCCT